MQYVNSFGRDFNAAHIVNTIRTFVKEGSTTDCKDNIAGRNRSLSHYRDIDNCKDGIILELDGNDNVRKP